MKFEPEFKEAISQLSSKDKDKLILRLLRRDHILANRLYFELLSTDSVQDRRTKVENHIKTLIKNKSNTAHYLNYLLLEMRDLSGQITEHVKITQDKYGEASLNLLMLVEVLKYNGNKILNLNKVYKLGIYIIARTFKILSLIKSLDEDYLIDFEDNLKLLAELIENNPSLTRLATENELDINWLKKVEIPDNITNIHKDLRARGLLRLRQI